MTRQMERLLISSYWDANAEGEGVSLRMVRSEGRCRLHYLLSASPFSLAQCCRAFRGGIGILLFKHNLKQVSYKRPVMEAETGGRPGVLPTWLSLPPRTELEENL